jgi:phospholipid/cholesterol/gamma-HCH transport system substrate-binding protein
MGGTFTYLQDWLEKNGDSLATAVSSFGDVMQEENQTLKQVNNSKIIANVDQGTAYFASLMKQVRDSMQELCDAKFFTNMGSIATNIAHTTGSIANAKGTLGKLIEEDDMYMQVTSLFTKADTLMNDINHYGILFHLNKTWQRQRLQQITELNALSTPAAFRSYFEQEVQDVNLALSRLSLLLEKADQSPDKERIFENKQFAKDFAEFLREVNNLSKSVKEYNEQLVEKQYKLQDAS